jgi:S-DNA-T family DNA segregation ATPase FtsK/SpoIIIE
MNVALSRASFHVNPEVFFFLRRHAGGTVLSMTYSLHTLTSSRASAPATPSRSGWWRFAHEIGLTIGFVLLIFWLLALSSYSTQDVAWSTSGSGAAVRNRAGLLGAWVADTSYFALGFSVWWCLGAGMRAWLASLALWLRGRDLLTQAQASGVPTPSAFAKFAASSTAFWFGLTMLLYASSTLEWSRLYSLESRLPGHSGGVLGYLAGAWSVKWLGFSGSALVAIVLGLAGLGLVFRFSWGQVVERLGAWLQFQIESRREKREVAQDIALGQQAAREREEVVFEEREEVAVHHPKPVPVQIEPVLVDVPKSERVAKERQKPCSPKCPTASCRRLICSMARSCARKPSPPRRWK